MIFPSPFLSLRRPSRQPAVYPNRITQAKSAWQDTNRDVGRRLSFPPRHAWNFQIPTTPSKRRRSIL